MTFCGRRQLLLASSNKPRASFSGRALAPKCYKSAVWCDLRHLRKHCYPKGELSQSKSEYGIIGLRKHRLCRRNPDRNVVACDSTATYNQPSPRAQPFLAVAIPCIIVWLAQGEQLPATSYTELSLLTGSCRHRAAGRNLILSISLKTERIYNDRLGSGYRCAAPARMGDSPALPQRGIHWSLECEGAESSHSSLSGSTCRVRSQLIGRILVR